jgi:hypothetical protein
MPVAHLQIKYKASAARMSEATSKSTPMRRIRSALCDRAADQSDEVAPFHCRCLRASDRKDSTPQLRQETAALRDFDPAYVAAGSIASESQAVPNDGPRPVSSKPGPQFRKTDVFESRASSSASRFTAAHAGFFHLEPIR